MYKLYLCLQYLLKRALAYFAMVGVMLCVFMMLVSVSVLNGFVEKIERAAKGLFGDVVVSSASLGGMAYYDEFIGKVKREVPGVEGASPFVLTFGILRVPGTDYRRTVQVAGIRLPERAEVSDFEEGLFVQEGVKQPTFDPPRERVLRRLEADLRRTAGLLERTLKAPEAGGKLPPEQLAQAERIRNAMDYQELAIANFRSDQANRGDLDRLQELWKQADDAGDEAQVKYLDQRIDALKRRLILPPDRRTILGLGIPGLTHRTPRGETIRTIGPGQQVVLSLIPLGRRMSYAEITPSTQSFTVIDDCSTDVSSIDSEIAYVPFETLQLLNNMSQEAAADDPNLIVERARCSQIHVKVRPELSQGVKLAEVARRVEGVWAEFSRAHPDAARSTVHVETWRERQSRLVNSIEAQRTLMVIILGMISTVAVVLIFVILYVIVVQKTRDIGVLKAVGASSGGVAGIFLAYGAAIGLVGAVFGSIGGYYFVRNINPIHDWIGRASGFVVWSRETFMFEKIPNEVGWSTVLRIAVAAVLAGILGALLPAVQAARKQPVEALRYE
ncbi:MAG TPA: FtsX-like permease family protein [Phycisphaerae bacterium]|nr:FtsX-like permease family protein [Phycisphaerae bacterium]